MANGARAASGVAFRMLRQLGSRAVPTYAAIRDAHGLVVVHRFTRAPRPPLGVAAVDAAGLAAVHRDARCLAKNWHPNVARVRHIDLAGDELSVTTEMIDGGTLADLFAAAATQRVRGVRDEEAGDAVLALPMVVRILVDVLGGLHGLHSLREGTDGVIGAIHGELCPANVVVGKDGIARVINPLRARPVGVGSGSEALAYAAPEALDLGGTNDPRSDVYSAGAILWQALTGRQLYDDGEPARILARQREEDVARPVLPPGSPFAKLADVTMRALAFDPALRFTSAAAMATELRKIAGVRIASGGVVATCVTELAGDRIRARRAELEPAPSGTRRRAGGSAAPLAEAAESAMSALEGIATRDDERLTLTATADAFAVPGLPASSPALPAAPAPPVAPVAPVAEQSGPRSPAARTSEPRLPPAAKSAPKVPPAPASEPRMPPAAKPAPQLPSAAARSAPIAPRTPPPVPRKPAPPSPVEASRTAPIAQVHAPPVEAPPVEGDGARDSVPSVIIAPDSERSLPRVPESDPSVVVAPESSRSAVEAPVVADLVLRVPSRQAAAPPPPREPVMMLAASPSSSAATRDKPTVLTPSAPPPSNKRRGIVILAACMVLLLSVGAAIAMRAVTDSTATRAREPVAATATTTATAPVAEPAVTAAPPPAPPVVETAVAEAPAAPAVVAVPEEPPAPTAEEQPEPVSDTAARPAQPIRTAAPADHRPARPAAAASSVAPRPKKSNYEPLGI